MSEQEVDTQAPVLETRIVVRRLSDVAEITARCCSRWRHPGVTCCLVIGLIIPKTGGAS